MSAFVDSSSSEDDISSLGDWRQISKRLDSDFESSSESEEEAPMIQSFTSQTSASSNNMSSSSIQPHLKRAPKPKKAKIERVQRESRARAFACTYNANCDRSYTSQKNLRKHLADHQGMFTLLKMISVAQTLIFRHKANVPVHRLL